jgi:hypothetical protein
VGNANFVAVNKSIASSAVIGESEIRAYEKLAVNSAAETQAELQAERDRLQELSKKREQSWTNTVEASRLQQLEARAARLANEEKRRQMIDAEEAAYRSEQRERAIVSATEQLANRDERMRNAYTQILLHHTMEGREPQLARKASSKEREAEQNRQEMARCRELSEQEVIEKRIAATKVREDCMLVKQANLHQLDEQIHGRRQVRDDQRLQRTHTDALAQAELLAAKIDDDQRKLNNRRLAEESISDRPYKSPRTLLEERRQEAAATEAELTAYANSRNEFVTKIADLKADKQNRRQQLIDLTASNLAKTLEESTKAMEASIPKSPRSMFEKMVDADLQRVESYKKPPHDFSIAVTPRRIADLQKQREEDARLAQRIRELQEMEHKLDAAAAAEQRDLAAKYQHFLKLQAQQKKTAEVMTKQEEANMAEQWQQAQEAERTMFKQLIELQLPENINRRLAQRALAPLTSPLTSPTAVSPRNKLPESPRNVKK